MKSKNLIIIKNNQKGQVALLIVFIVMFLLLFVALALTKMTIKQTKITNNTFQSVQAYYLADAGIEQILYLTKGTSIINLEDFDVDDELVNESIDGLGSFKTIKTNNSPLGLKVTGYFKNTARAVELSW